VSTATAPQTGVEGFIAQLDRCQIHPVVESNLVTYLVTPVAGALAGQSTRTGVCVDELAPWPVAPPHWIHLPSDISFAATNVAPSPLGGWAAHSRDISGWGLAASPIDAWLSHVRGVLEDARR
jgi:hypothetical protein